jgi:hypothetical protein
MAARKPQVVVAKASCVTEHDGKQVRIWAGARYVASHPLVKARPELFEAEHSAKLEAA